MYSRGTPAKKVGFRSLNENGEAYFGNRFSPQIQSHMRNGFSRESGPFGGLIDEKKNEVQKSHDTAPLSSHLAEYCR
jgi:hypothetical protein